MGIVMMRRGAGLGWMAVVWASWACSDPSAIPTSGEGSSTAPSSSDGLADSTSSSTTSTTSLDEGSTTATPTGTTTTGPLPDLPIFDVGEPGDDPPVCSSDLKEVLDPETGEVILSCPPDQGCAGGMCIPACMAAATAEGSIGCDFVIPTSPFYGNGNPGVQQSGPCHALLVANPWDRPAMLELSRGGETFDIELVGRIPQGIGPATIYDPLPPAGLPEDQVTVVFLAHRPGVVNGTSLECPITPAVLEDTAAHGTSTGLAFELHSDTPIQVYDIIPYGGGLTYLPSASLLFPSSAWGEGYLVVSPNLAIGSEWMLAVAAQDDTTVTVWPTVDITPGSIATPPVGMGTDYTIDAGEVIQWQSVGDPVGSVVTADKPIGMLTGNTYLQVNTMDAPGSGRDSEHQMIPDANALGTEYVGGGLFSRLPGFMPESVKYRIVGVVDGTTLSWDPQPMFAPGSLDAGDVFEFESRDFFSVRSTNDTRPFSLSQYMSGSLSGQPGCNGEVGTCPLGDDDWTMLVPPAQFLREYSFFVDPTYGTSTLVFVREEGAAGFSEVVLDCMGTIGGWQPVGVAGRYEVAHVELYRSGVGMVPACETSQHHASSDGDFGITVWGTDDQASYGYPAGGSLQTLNGVDVTPAG